jgi:hypothetical protein
VNQEAAEIAHPERDTEEKMTAGARSGRAVAAAKRPERRKGK